MGVLKGKVALITGAGTGVGQGIAYALAGEGVHVAAIGRTAKTLEETVTEIGRRGSKARAFVCDITDHGSLAPCIESVSQHFGRIDILVNNAQIVPAGRLLDLTNDQITKGFDSGPLATFYLMRLCYPYLKDGGSIVNLASYSNVREDCSGWGAYAAVKAAIWSFTRAAACEWGPDGIRANCIIPFADSAALQEWIASDPEGAKAHFKTVPLRRAGHCERDIGRFVVALCGPDLSYITGQLLAVDGGQAKLD